MLGALEAIQQARGERIDRRLPRRRTVTDVLKPLELGAQTNRLGRGELRTNAKHGLHARFGFTEGRHAGIQTGRRQSTFEEQTEAID